MDRHICRAKDINTGEWVYGYYICVPNKYGHDLAHLIIEQKCEYSGCGEFWWMDTHEVDPETVCRCTGWHDSNKTPIFEKDIVEFVGPNTHRDLIWWCNEMSEMTAIPVDGIEFNGYDFWNGKYPKANYSSFCLMMQDPYGDFREIKVVGNIVDNPELLEVQNEHFNQNGTRTFSYRRRSTFSF